MIIDQFVEPDFETLQSTLSAARGLNKVVVIFATCSVEWNGNRDGSIGTGQRIVLCKPDGSVSVHRPTGARAVARQGIGSKLQLVSSENGDLLYGSKSRGQNTIRVLLTEVSLAVVYDAIDDAEPEHDNTEAEIHESIASNPEILEDGLRIVHHEHSISVGTIDVVAADEDGNWVIIEVKNPYAKLSHVDQLRRYVKHYRTTEHGPVRGMLVAPRFGKKPSANSVKSVAKNMRSNNFTRKIWNPVNLRSRSGSERSIAGG
ncbi:endonuclease NucS domain-containing protein [Halorubrum sp. BOL3-1]|uniref:endonuclease NucS domain-containing protein n=1 Tax=Halorubrum sp. BOL3-1 TaxID=2497325 RepID=UPI001409FB0A|nr:endonuclease NucS domain-containing protein [Halorubrum sp. BOL3-1]